MILEPAWGDNYKRLTGRELFLDTMILIAGLWVLLLVVALRRYRKRGLWLLIGMPLVFYWIVVFSLLRLGYVQAPTYP